jgi:hypothetical protein
LGNPGASPLIGDEEREFAIIQKAIHGLAMRAKTPLDVR